MYQNKGQELYRKAKEIIPGGTMLLSKRPEMFLPGLWPSYFKKAKDSYIWDLDGNKYLDMCIMGIGTNTLGYSNIKVDKAVKKAIKNGNMSTLNCFEEVQLAEKLIELNPWADMVRFARTGGEANAIAIRIARAASGRDKVAICGYHGWHDWYLSVNHNDVGADLSNHLLPGLSPKGVPEDLKNSVIPFTYNNYDELEKIIENNNIGVIKMEVIRNVQPENGFLNKVRDLATKKNIVLIFDECTSGFRETYGGIFKKYNVIPDIAIYGKTLGNGYAITAVVGIKEVMESAQKTFISSTFWTERIGSVAALATLDVMEKEKSWEKITKIGLKMREIWQEASISNDVSIKIFGIPALSTFIFLHQNHSKFKTFLTQEFLNHGILATTTFYASICHSDDHLDKYKYILNKIFSLIKKSINGELNIDNLLKGKIAHSTFKRLN